MIGIEEKRITLYTHSPESQKAIDDGEAVISSGGPRRPDGTLLEMAKPLSFTISELRDMVGNEARIQTTEDEVQKIGKQIGLTQSGIEQLSQTTWLTNKVIGQVYNLTYKGFQKTLIGLENISSQVSELQYYVIQRDTKKVKQDIQRYTNILRSAAGKLDIPTFDVVNCNIDRDLDEIAAFIKAFYDDLCDNTGTARFACDLILALLMPFTYVVRKYSVLFYYASGMWPGDFEEWLSIINIANDRRYLDQIQYYIYLETELSYRDKVLLGKTCKRKLLTLPNSVSFDTEFALYHGREEYLRLGTRIQEALSSPEFLMGDGILYL